MKHIWRIADTAHCFKVIHIHKNDLWILRSLAISSFITKEDSVTYRITKDGLWQLQTLHYLDKEKYKHPGKKTIYDIYNKYRGVVTFLVCAAATKIIEFLVQHLLDLFF